MENFQLKPMTDFVIERTKVMYDKVAAKVETAVFEYIAEVPNYANFMKQPLAPGMFFPCHEDGNPFDLPLIKTKDVVFDLQQENLLKEAENKCLFIIPIENCELAEDVILINDRQIMISLESGNLLWKTSTYKTVEDIANDPDLKFWLSPTAIKKIGL